jgi:glycerol-3-phosphate dehydrogenase
MAAPSSSVTYDIAIIGGGINGCGIARDAAGRGLNVFLCEMGDLASGTSSWSTKLIHGGLRYLEYYEFRLVREALREREVLLHNAPHLIHPLRLVLPHHKGLRPAWLLRTGLFIYDHLSSQRILPGTRTIDLTSDPLGAPLRAGEFTRGFEFSDCTVDDSRLVVVNAREAADIGATIKTRTRAVDVKPQGREWQVVLENMRNGERSEISARTVINAAGPWVESVLRGAEEVSPKANVRLVQGSHIVVRRLYDHNRAYMFQNADGRIIFVIPYRRDFTLIGTTDRDYDGDPAKVTATSDEIAYLCKAASEYLARPVTPDQVVWSYSGVRPLYDDGASEAKAATRDYVFELDKTSQGAAMLSVFGGKITTYRKLAEAALEKLAPLFSDRDNMKREWTGDAPLPGGDFPVTGFDELVPSLHTEYSFLSEDDAHRLCCAYGTIAWGILGPAKKRSDLGRDFGAGLSEAEVRYLMNREWAETAEDILWRRTKLGLVFTPEQVAALEQWMSERKGTASN